MLHPIGFCIPSEKIVSEVTPKKKPMAFLIPKGLFEKRETYIYENEEEYYKDYRDSVFARTKKKKGWDCLRHYEIMAQGCIPVFENLEDCPKNTMTFLPKEKLIEAKALYETLKHETNVEVFKKCSVLANQLLEYTRQHLTCERMAKYILESTGNAKAKNILFIPGIKLCANYPNYLRDLLLIGFKKILGKNCHDSPRVPHIYSDYPEKQVKSLYGKGFTYSKNIDASLRDPVKDDTLMFDIESNFYDLVIYGSYNRGMPLFHQVLSSYPTNKIIFICSEDVYSGNGREFIRKGHHVFVREIPNNNFQ